MYFFTKNNAFFADLSSQFTDKNSKSVFGAQIIAILPYFQFLTTKFLSLISGSIVRAILSSPLCNLFLHMYKVCLA